MRREFQGLAAQADALHNVSILFPHSGQPETLEDELEEEAKQEESEGEELVPATDDLVPEHQEERIHLDEPVMEEPLPRQLGSGWLFGCCMALPIRIMFMQTLEIVE